MTKAGPKRAEIVDIWKSGNESGGIAAGIGVTRRKVNPAVILCSIKKAIPLPTITAISIAGTNRFSGRQTRITMSVINTKSGAGQSKRFSDIARTANAPVSSTEDPRGISIPSNVPTWLLMIKSAAPTVNPTMTECGTLSTHFPRPPRPKAI